MRRSVHFIAALYLSAVSTVAFGADAAPVKVLATIAIQGAFTDVQPMLGANAKTEFGQTVPLVERLNKAFTEALSSNELKARLSSLMAEPAPTTPDQFAAFIKAELHKYERLVKISGAKVD